MSEYRHFRDSRGVVHTYDTETPPGQSTFVEVQVAPLDAIVIDGPRLNVTIEAAEAIVRERLGMSHRVALREDDLARAEASAQALAKSVQMLRERAAMDEVKVDKLQDLLMEVGVDHARHVAHALVATGRVEVSKS